MKLVAAAMAAVRRGGPTWKNDGELRPEKLPNAKVCKQRPGWLSMRQLASACCSLAAAWVARHQETRTLFHSCEAPAIRRQSLRGHGKVREREGGHERDSMATHIGTRAGEQRTSSRTLAAHCLPSGTCTGPHICGR